MQAEKSKKSKIMFVCAQKMCKEYYDHNIMNKRDGCVNF